MKIQLSESPIIKDHLTVWQQPGPGIDLTMDLKALTFRPDSLDEICAFHVLDHLFPEETQKALRNWYTCLKPGGTVYLVVDNFEYVARAIVGGDISVDVFNREHCHPMQFSQDSLGRLVMGSGFNEQGVVVWYQDVPDLFKRKHYELVIAAKK